MRTELTITGLDKLIAKLEAITRDDVIRRSLQSGGIRIAEWAVQNRMQGPRPTYIGIRSGRLTSSLSKITALTPVDKSGNVYTKKVGTNVEYAAIHEFGGFAGRGGRVRIPARPYLRPSLEDDSNQKWILNEFTKNINEALEKA